MALRDITIRGEIRTNVDYCLDMIQVHVGVHTEVRVNREKITCACGDMRARQGEADRPGGDMSFNAGRLSFKTRREYIMS